MTPDGWLVLACRLTWVTITTANMSTFNDDPAKDFEDTHSLYEDKFVTKPNLTLAQDRFEGAMKALEQTAMRQRFRLLALITSAASKDKLVYCSP